MTQLEVKESSVVPSRLVVESGEHEGMVFPLRDSMVSVGRGPNNTIQIIDTRMSRNHSLFILNERNWHVRDLGSKNGTQHNAQTITHDEPLRHGDRVQIGDTVFVFEHERQAQGVSDTTSGMRVLEDDGMVVPSKVLRLTGEAIDMDVEAPVFSISDESREHLQVLYQVADIISSILDLDELLEKVIDLIQEYLGADRAGILLYDEKHEVLLPKVTRRPADSTDDIVISNSIITRAVREQVAVVVSDAPHDYRFRACDSIIIQRIHSAICAPLVYKNEVEGVVYVDRRRAGENFQEEDLKLVSGISKQAAMAIANSRLHRQMLEQHVQERELEIARSIQQNLQPRKMPDIDGFEISGVSRPARSVGGDYFDVIPLGDGRVAMAVVDVSGKGVGAAILVAAVRAALQIEVRELTEDSLINVVERLNQMVCRDTSSTLFATMVLGVLDPAMRTFTYSNAGHVYPMLAREDARISTLETGGCLLGVMPGAVYEQETVEMAPGSVLLMFTDGVTDTINTKSEMFETQRVAEALTHDLSRPAEVIRRKIEEKARVFAEGTEPFDDFTLLVVKAAAD